MFAGGMTRKEITVLGGRPGHGKTTLVINMVKGLIDQGFKYLGVLNMHGGNIILKTAVREVNFQNKNGITVLCNPSVI